MDRDSQKRKISYIAGFLIAECFTEQVTILILLDGFIMKESLYMEILQENLKLLILQMKNINLSAPYKTNIRMAMVHQKRTSLSTLVLLKTMNSMVKGRSNILMIILHMLVNSMRDTNMVLAFFAHSILNMQEISTMITLMGKVNFIYLQTKIIQKWNKFFAISIKLALLRTIF